MGLDFERRAWQGWLGHGLVVGLAALLVACGGASNRETQAIDAATAAANTTTGSLFTSAPAALTFASGAPATSYAIGGGSAPYTSGSSNLSVINASVSGGVLRLTAGAPGSATVSIVDKAGGKVELAVTVTALGTIAPLRTTAPSAITLGTRTAGNYTVTGGVPPYLASSSSPSALTAGMNGATLTITAGASAATAQVLVTDSAGTQLTIAVTVGATSTLDLFTSAPTSITLSNTTNQASFTVGGGVPPYSVSSGNPGVVGASVNGTSLNIFGANVGSTTVVIVDAVGTRIELGVSVTAAATGSASALRTTAPSAITLNTNASATYAIAGGAPPYVASSSAPAAVSTTVSGTNLAISAGASAAAAQILVTDSAGAQVVIAVTVGSTSTPALFTSAPATVTLAGAASSASFTVGGGVPPYSVSSSNAGVANTSVNGNTLSIVGVTVGGATVVVVDSAGTRIELGVTVGTSVPTLTFFTTAPTAITMAAGTVNTYTVAGGSAPYAASSANTSVARATVIGSTLTITGVGSGATQVVVLDSTGTQILIGVTVGAAAAQPLTSTAPATVTIASGAAPATYTVSGGTLPYSAVSSNSIVVDAFMVGPTLALNGRTVGSATVDVVDANGSKVSTVVTVSSSTGVSLAVLPSGATGNVGDTLQFTLLGGSPAYTVSVSNASIATLSTTAVGSNGGTFNATLVNVGDAVVSVRDAQGQTTSFVLTVGAVGPLLRLSPSAFVVGENETNAITLNVFGGTAPYRALTSDLRLSGVSTSGSTLVSTVGSTTNRCINPKSDDVPPLYVPYGTYSITLTVIDSLGASATSTMTIKDNGAGDGVGCP